MVSYFSPFVKVVRNTHDGSFDLWWLICILHHHSNVQNRHYYSNITWTVSSTSCLLRRSSRIIPGVCWTWEMPVYRSLSPPCLDLIAQSLPLLCLKRGAWWTNTDLDLSSSINTLFVFRIHSVNHCKYFYIREGPLYGITTLESSSPLHGITTLESSIISFFTQPNNRNCKTQ